jgi:poly(3-hydroxybutyrate) depolymerase
MLRAIAPIIGLPHRGDHRSPGRKRALPVLLITGTADTTVPPGAWDDAAHTTTSNAHDRFFYTGATAIIRRWSAAAGCEVTHPEHPFDTGVVPFDCRSYCGATARAWPAVLDCRAPMGHDYDLTRAWPLILDFFDRL